MVIHRPSKRSPGRPGLATLEMALSLPFLAIMAAVLLMTGEAGTLRLQATVDARQQAWKQRHGASIGGSLSIQPSGDDLIQAEATRTVKAPRALASLAGTAHSQHAVLGGSLDYHDVPFDSPPDFEFALNITGKSLAEGFVAGLRNQFISGIVGGDGFLGQLGQMEFEGRAQLEEARRTLEQRRQELQAKRREIETGLRQAEQQARNLTNQVRRLDEQLRKLRETDRSQAEKIKDNTQRKEALDKIDRQVKALEQERNGDENQLNAVQERLQKLQSAAEAFDLFR